MSRVLLSTALATLAALAAAQPSAIKEIQRRSAAARSIESRTERAATLPAALVQHMRTRGFQLTAGPRVSYSVWMVHPPPARACETSTWFIAFPADASEDAMRGYLVRFNLGSFLNAPSRLAMFYPTVRPHGALTSCPASSAERDAYARRLIAAFDSVTPPR